MLFITQKAVTAQIIVIILEKMLPSSEKKLFHRFIYQISFHRFFSPKVLLYFKKKSMKWNFKSQISKCPDLRGILPPFLTHIMHYNSFNKQMFLTHVQIITLYIEKMGPDLVSYLLIRLNILHNYFFRVCQIFWYLESKERMKNTVYSNNL